MHSTNSAVKFNDTKNGTVRHLVSMEPSLFIDQIRSCKTSRTVSFLKTLRDLKGIDFQWKICNIKGSHDKHRSLQNDTGTQNTQMQQLKGVSYISQLNSRPGLKKATLCFQGGNSILKSPLRMQSLGEKVTDCLEYCFVITYPASESPMVLWTCLLLPSQSQTQIITW